MIELRGPVSELVQRIVRELVAEPLNGTSETPTETLLSRRQSPSQATNGPRGGWATFFARQRERPPAPKRIHKTLLSQLDRSWAEQRRAQIAHARSNGVTLEERDGRTYRVLHLPAADGRLSTVSQG